MLSSMVGSTSLIFAVGYHVIPATTGAYLERKSNKSEHAVTFCHSFTLFLSKSADSTLIQSVAAILVTMGLFPILAASTNLLATTRGDAGPFSKSLEHAIAAGASIANFCRVGILHRSQCDGRDVSNW